MIRLLISLAAFLVAAAPAFGTDDNIWLNRPAGMVGWDFSGHRLTSPTGHSGTLVGNASLATGTRFLALDGAGDYMSVADDDRLDFAGDFAVAAWFKRSGIPTASNIICGKFDSSTNTGFILYIVPTSGQAGFDGGVGSGYRVGTRTPGSVCDNNWHHVAAVRSGSTWMIYLDGALAASSTVASGSVANAKSLGIGGYDAFGGWTSFFTGSIAGVRLYGYAPSAGDLAKIANSGFSRIANGGTP